jgi:hypothetical protein
MKDMESFRQMQDELEQENLAEARENNRVLQEIEDRQLNRDDDKNELLEYAKDELEKYS